MMSVRNSKVAIGILTGLICVYRQLCFVIALRIIIIIEPASSGVYAQRPIVWSFDKHYMHMNASYITI